MTRKTKASTSLFAALLLTACASTRQFVSLPNQSKAIDDPAKARLYVMRPTSFGGAISMSVYDGDKQIGNTGPGGCLSWEREPGDIELLGKAENTDHLPLSVKKGVVYYVQQHVNLGFLIARNKLSLLTESEGKEMVPQCKFGEVETASK